MPNPVGKTFHIGTVGKPWGTEERAAWLAELKVKRSYHEEVVDKLEPLKADFDVHQYGALTYGAPDDYPLFAVQTRSWDASKPSVLVTGGVHGYETSGVQGALLFASTKMRHYSQWCNILVAPCVSPWGYAHIQRWNAKAEDPNRSFKSDALGEESSALFSLLSSLHVQQWLMHIDCHETTDTDETEFRPAKAARDGVRFEPGTIPDGFYLVGNSEAPYPEWHTAMIEAVKQETHIAPDASILGEPVGPPGCIFVPSSSLGLCASATNATYAATTEVYPDSEQADDEVCNRAQVACITGGLDYLLSHLGLK
eukprot:CAMPEP_0181327328 /NCGR_PEP_ID=MMETSP1101-20121128/22038_1 /TAXON_ID=46948 /ORGANISM="Rhodomonas abbreviata, Strain Caron Lab Isolate" /LENGTH=310 /DNA_ID=CAMNT_0023435971 /DNA_START=221 /DNA_END=1153 /DNA_ORIENTATION=+